MYFTIAGECEYYIINVIIIPVNNTVFEKRFLPPKKYSMIFSMFWYHSCVWFYIWISKHFNFNSSKCVDVTISLKYAFNEHLYKSDWHKVKLAYYKIQFGSCWYFILFLLKMKMLQCCLQPVTFMLKASGC